jgi:hypothetical protein
MCVAGGTFGTWDETATNLHLALLAGALDRLGYGRALGKFIHDDGVTLPSPTELAAALIAQPTHPLASPRVDLLRAMWEFAWNPGCVRIDTDGSTRRSCVRRFVTVCR